MRMPVNENTLKPCFCFRSALIGLLYFLDFLVVFLGISVSFWMNEWNSDRKNDRLHHIDIHALLVDLDHDYQSLNRVHDHILEGDAKRP